MSSYRKVVVVGLDGLEPSLVESMLAAGRLPNLARTREAGGYSTVRTTYPAQTPVAWSSFSTGTNPGGHGIFDFIRRNPETYLPDIGLNRYEQKSAFLPPRAVNLRRGTPVWNLLSEAGLPSTIIRCPCTYPPDEVRGRLLSGMGVPDIRGGFGTSTFYTTREGVCSQESETVVPVTVDRDAVIRTHLIGPRNPKTGSDSTLEIELHLDTPEGRATLRSSGTPDSLVLRPGEWSEWLHVKFKLGMLQSVKGVLRLYLASLEPEIELYASPINFDPEAPMFPISSPWEYSMELSRELGTYYTAGMVEDHTGLNNGRFDESAYLDQCEEALRQREAMMLYELDRFEEGLFFCLFDTPDRIQHMFWRFREPDHPANRGRANGDLGVVIDDHYDRCDAIVGRALEYADDDTLVVVLSDHGFSSFQRGVNLNTWLHDQGLLNLTNGVEPGEEAGDFFAEVDWERTQAYALGLGSVYLNRAGREAGGTVEAEEAERLKRRIAEGLTGLCDPERGEMAIRSVVARERIYDGPFVEEAPDLLVNFSPGYRASWATALGGVPADPFEDNIKRWSGDHIIDPALVPGILFMNRPFSTDGADLTDLAPTILSALGVPRGSEMEGESLLG